MGKFLVKQTGTGYKFDLAAGNGEVIATSEVYTSEASCLGGIESVIKCAAVAETEDQTAANAFSGSICREIGIGSIWCLAQITDGRLPISRTFFPVPDNRQ